MVTRSTAKLYRRFNIKECSVAIQRNAELEKMILNQPGKVIERRHTVQNGDLHNDQEENRFPAIDEELTENDDFDGNLIYDSTSEGDEPEQTQPQPQPQGPFLVYGYSSSEVEEVQQPNRLQVGQERRRVPELIPINSGNPEIRLLAFARAQAAKLDARDLARLIK